MQHLRASSFISTRNLFKPQHLHEFNQKKVDSRKNPSDNGSSVNKCIQSIMKSIFFRAVSALSLAALLAACGAGNSIEQPMATSGLAQAADTTDQPIVTAATSTMPAPDCAADGCRSLRIIDANAEAYRYDAARRAADTPS
jgi:hypothetical protein